jgi:hypothetical protein
MLAIGIELSEQRRGVGRIEHDGRAGAERFGHVAFEHRVRVDGPFYPVVVFEAPHRRKRIGLVGIGVARRNGRRLARPQRRKLHRRVELDEVRHVDLERAVLVFLAQPRQQEIPGPVECVEAAEARGRMRRIAVLLCDIDDLDEFEPGLDLVPVQGGIARGVGEDGRPYQRRRYSPALEILPAQALRNVPQLGGALERHEGIDGVRIEQLQVQHVRRAVDAHRLAVVAELADMAARAGDADELQAGREGIGRQAQADSEPVIACGVRHQAVTLQILDERLRRIGVGDIDRGEERPRQDLRALAEVVIVLLLPARQSVGIARHQ